MILALSTILVLLLLSAFFSASETALTAASKPLMHQLERRGNRRAGLVNRLRERKERLIGAVLVGNNAVNILASALATSLAIAAFGEAGVAVATAAMTLVILVFGEILPKTYAFHHPNRTAIVLAPIVKFVVMTLAPVTHTLQALVRGIFRIFGVDVAGGSMAPADEELRGAIELHAGGEEPKPQRRAMLHSVLDLAEVQVGEIMIHRRNVATINADDPPDAVVSQALESPYTRLPLWRGDADNIVGVLHAKALVRALLARKDEGLRGLDVVSFAAKPWFIPDTTLLLDQLNAFRSRREHFALVVDEYGSLMGIVTLEDILEEIVGDISDEHDLAVPGVKALPDGSYIVKGSVTIRDVNREYGWGLPDEDASTLAGLVLHESRRIPDVGQAFLFHGFRFEILNRQRHQIVALRVTPPREKMAPLAAGARERPAG
jgi:Mg2+/Co2+ transporter CorB